MMPPPSTPSPVSDVRQVRLPIPRLLRMRQEISRVGLHWISGEQDKAWALIRSCYGEYGATFLFNLHWTLARVLTELGEQPSGHVPDKDAVMAQGPAAAMAANIKLAVDFLLQLSLKPHDEAVEGVEEVEGLVQQNWEWTDGVTVTLLDRLLARPGAAEGLHEIERRAAQLREEDAAGLAQRLGLRP